MLCSNIVVVEVSGLVVCEVDDSLCPWRKSHILAWSYFAFRKLFFYFGANLRRTDTEPLDDSSCHAVTFPDKTEQQVFGADIAFTKLLRFFLGEEDDFPCSFRESLPHVVPIF